MRLCAHTVHGYVPAEVLGLRAEIGFSLALPSFSVLISKLCSSNTETLVTALLLVPLKSLKSHVDLVPLVEIWSLSGRNLEEMVSESPHSADGTDIFNC